MARTKDTPSFPRTERQLRAWLRDVPAGQQLVRDLASGVLEMECRRCERARPYPRVLVVIRRLGPLPGVEVFSERGVTVRLEELVDTQDDPVIEVLAEELLVAQLPRL